MSHLPSLFSWSGDHNVPAAAEGRTALLRRAESLGVLVLTLLCSPMEDSTAAAWEPLGLSGGGGMFAPAISPVDPALMILNCDMSAAYLSSDGGRNWRMIHHAQLRSDTGCRPGFHPTDRKIIYASSGGQLKVSRDGGLTFGSMGNLQDGLQGEIAINPGDPRLMLVGTHRGQCQLSRDGGVTWKPCVGPTGRFLGFFFDHVSPEPVLFAASDRGIWRSTDGGGSWVEKTHGLPWKEVRSFAGGANTESQTVMVYCTVTSRAEDGNFRGGVYRSRDRGETWEPAMGKGLNKETQAADQWAFGPIAQYNQILTTDARPQTVYVLNTSTGFHPPHHDTVFRSDDGGGTWRDIYFMDPRFQRYNVEPDYVTASAGQSFKGGETPFGVAICNRDPDRLILVRNEPHITHDGGQTWVAGHTYPAPGQTPKPGSAWQCNGLVVTTTWNYYIDPFEPNRHYIAYTDIGMARSLDRGKSWIWWDPKAWAPWRNTCYELAFDPEVPGKVWGAFSDVHDIPNDNIISERHGHDRPGGVCISTNFGASWRNEASGIPPQAVTSVVLDPRSPKESRVLYAGVFQGGVYKTTDSGKTWRLKKEGLGHPDNLRVSRVLLHKSGALFAMICARRPAPGKPLAPEGVGLYRSFDGAETWEKVNVTCHFLYPKDFSVHPDDPNRILIGTCDSSGGTQGGGLYSTEDGGKSWKRIGREGSQTFGGYFHPAREGWIYMTLTEGAPGAGLWLSRDRGATWRPLAGLPFSNVQRVAFDPSDQSRIYVTTFGGSVWRGPADPDGE